MSSNYLSWTPTVGRNSAFVDLTYEQKEELGGIEYRTLKLLTKVLVCYFVGFHILCVILLLPWALKKPFFNSFLHSLGITPIWWSFFTAQSTFNDLGFTLTSDSMISYQKEPYVLLIMSIFIVIGNTGFPCFLRFIIWLIFKFSPSDSSIKECTGFLLDHPRRCFTLLFPSGATWWLFLVLVLMNSIDLIFFILLDFNSPVVQNLPPKLKIINGLFMSLSTRTAGFTSVPISQLHPSIQVSYMIMMYISVLPVAISIRKTNVYEEQTLGIYNNNISPDYEEIQQTVNDNSGKQSSIISLKDQVKSPKHQSYVVAHLRKQLSYDLWYVFLGFFIICISEGDRIKDPSDIGMTGFTILFEMISAYGTVGMSLGYDGVNTSLCGVFKTVSKLIIIAMLIRGRHRGLPYSLDRAIILPSEDMHKKDEILSQPHVRRRTLSNAMELPRTETTEHPYSINLQNFDKLINNEADNPLINKHPKTSFINGRINLCDLTKDSTSKIKEGLSPLSSINEEL